jgi:hypothetical protein
MTQNFDLLIRRLDNQLYSLGMRISLSKGKEKGELGRHIGTFSVWVQDASALGENWTSELGTKLQAMRESLKQGRSEEDFLCPLLRCVVEASSRIHLLMSEIDEAEKVH